MKKMKKMKKMKTVLVLLAIFMGVAFSSCETLEKEKKSPCELGSYGTVDVVNSTPYQIQVYIEYGNRKTSSTYVSSGRVAHFTRVPEGTVAVVARLDKSGYDYLRLRSFHLASCDEVEYTVSMSSSSAYESQGSIIGNLNLNFNK